MRHSGYVDGNEEVTWWNQRQALHGKVDGIGGRYHRFLWGVVVQVPPPRPLPPAQEGRWVPPLRLLPRHRRPRQPVMRLSTTKPRHINSTLALHH